LRKLLGCSVGVGREFQFRLTCSLPVAPPDLVSETDGLDLVSVTFDRETGGVP